MLRIDLSPFLCYNILDEVMILIGQDKFKKTFDFTYELVKRKVPNIRFPCYGGRFKWFLFFRHFWKYYFYLTPDSFVYTLGSRILQIPFQDITRIKIKKGLLRKSHYHIWLRADKKYHFLICDMKDFTTELTGISSENVKNFIETIKKNVIL